MTFNKWFKNKSEGLTFFQKTILWPYALLLYLFVQGEKVQVDNYELVFYGDLGETVVVKDSYVRIIRKLKIIWIPWYSDNSYPVNNIGNIKLNYGLFFPLSSIVFFKGKKFFSTLLPFDNILFIGKKKLEDANKLKEYIENYHRNNIEDLDVNNPKREAPVLESQSGPGTIKIVSAEYIKNLSENKNQLDSNTEERSVEKIRKDMRELEHRFDEGDISESVFTIRFKNLQQELEE